jgi:hypothetical protein
MKYVAASLIAACLLPAGPASAASLAITSAGGDNLAFYVRGEATIFDSIQVDIVPQSGVTFLNPVTNSQSVGKQPNDPFTFRNREMDVDFGWLIGSQTINANTFSYGVTAPGAKIDTSVLPNNRLFLGNIVTSQTPVWPTRLVQFTIVLVNEGMTVQTLSFIPEPAAATLTVMALAAFIPLCRRVRSPLKS